MADKTVGSRRPFANGPSWEGLGVAGRQKPPTSPDYVSDQLWKLKFYQQLKPNVQRKVRKIVSFVEYPSGTVLFRQGDPPGNLYIIQSGTVGIFKTDEEKKMLHSDVFDGATRNRRHSCPPTSRAKSSEDSATTTLHRSWSMSSWERAELTKTAEGFSTYKHISEVGAQISRLEQGDMLGELALLKGQPRAASVRCLQRSEFMLIPRHEFDQVLKADLAHAENQKVTFLRDHLPGMKELALPNSGLKMHASYFFQKSRFCTGHRFLREATIENDAIYVLIAGAVEFRQRIQRVNSTSQLPPLKEALRAQQMKRAMLTGPPTHSSSPARRRSLAHLAHGFADGFPESHKSKRDACVVVSGVQDGGVFASLPFSSPEPFSVVAVQPCEVYCAVGVDVARLPPTLLDAVRQYLLGATSWRLEMLQSQMRRHKLRQS